jgi:hypothetical protein
MAEKVIKNSKQFINVCCCHWCIATFETATEKFQPFLIVNNDNHFYKVTIIFNILGS